MNVYTDFERYTVLLHTFDTLEGACEYMHQIIAKGECKVLPLIKAWEGSKVVAQWMAKETSNGVKFILIEDSDFTHSMPQQTIDTIFTLENKAESDDDDIVFLARMDDGNYYTTGSSALFIQRNFNTELQQKPESDIYITRFPATDIDKVLKRIIASGYRCCFVG